MRQILTFAALLAMLSFGGGCAMDGGCGGGCGGYYGGGGCGGGDCGPVQSGCSTCGGYSACDGCETCESGGPLDLVVGALGLRGCFTGCWFGGAEKWNDCGCGEWYFGEYSDPPDSARTQPCDCQGNYTGRHCAGPAYGRVFGQGAVIGDGEVISEDYAAAAPRRAVRRAPYSTSPQMASGDRVVRSNVPHVARAPAPKAQPTAAVRRAVVSPEDDMPEPPQADLQKASASRRAVAQ